MLRSVVCVLIGMTSLIEGVPGKAKDVVLAVNSDWVLRKGADRWIGINLNYIRDDDQNRPQARKLEAALKDLGVRWLRYPGGEKSNWYLWSSPPYERPQPVSVGRYAQFPGKRMDFDEYVACARAVRAEPYVVVGYNQVRTKEQWIENAVTWVRYTNQVRKYGIKYWDIGNENWMNPANDPTGMAHIVAEFSRAMKAEDPTIQVGSNGYDEKWWAKFLPGAAPYIDFISVSHYDTFDWHSYGYFPKHPTVDLAAGVRTALAAIDRYAPPDERGRLKVVVAETNSKDYSKDNPWPEDNSLGHALVTFETFGQLMRQPRVLCAMLWTTRWMDDNEAPRSQWYALDKSNQILPTGRAVALWGHFLRDELLDVEGGTGMISAYASQTADGRELNIWVVNRGYQEEDKITIAVRSQVQFQKAEIHQFSGSGPNDSSPTWRSLPSAGVTGNRVQVPRCPGVSITVLSLQP